MFSLFKARLNQQVVLQGHTDEPIEPKTENLSEINNEGISKEQTDVPMPNTDPNFTHLDQNIMDTLDDMKNPTSDLNLDNIHSAIFSENIAPVTENMDLPLNPMNVDPHSEGLTQTNQMESSATSWNHNSLSINNENDGLNPLLKADKNLNEMNNQSSDGNALQTPISIPDNRLISTSTDLAPLSEAITPSSLGLPLVSPVETVSTVSKDTPLSCNSNLDVQPKETKSPSPTPTPVGTVGVVNEPKPIKVPLNSPYELPKICLLMDENDVPKPPTRPPPTPITQLYPPTPSITVRSPNISLVSLCYKTFVDFHRSYHR